MGRFKAFSELIPSRENPPRIKFIQLGNLVLVEVDGQRTHSIRLSQWRNPLALRQHANLFKQLNNHTYYIFRFDACGWDSQRDTMRGRERVRTTFA